MEPISSAGHLRGQMRWSTKSNCTRPPPHPSRQFIAHNTTMLLVLAMLWNTGWMSNITFREHFCIYFRWPVIFQDVSQSSMVPTRPSFEPTRLVPSKLWGTEHARLWSALPSHYCRANMGALPLQCFTAIKMGCITANIISIAHADFCENGWMLEQ